MTFDASMHPRGEGGQFVVKSGTPATVQLANGQSSTLQPGELTPEAQEAYQSGQCLALAIELAESIDGGEVCLDIREDGQIAHAWCYYYDKKYGEMCIDSYGACDIRQFVDDRGTDEDNYDYLAPDAARRMLAEGEWKSLPPQDFDMARTFVSPVKELR